jgi:hypothetical protein
MTIWEMEKLKRVRLTRPKVLDGTSGRRRGMELKGKRTRESLQRMNQPL